ncbi:MAG TPA: hypothetical protein VM305_00050 [Candidatus Limnocylindrales bacterium]|nr:hypothetical protein [Candidatus Limnocylindrales bacterium]
MATIDRLGGRAPKPSSRDLWHEYRDQLRELALAAASSGRTVTSFIGGRGGRYFVAATPIGGGKVRLEWLGPNETRGAFATAPRAA